MYYSDEEEVTVDCLFDLNYKTFSKKTRITVKSGNKDYFFEPASLDKRNILEIHIRKPSSYFSSKDGTMIFDRTGRKNTCSLVMCTDKYKNVVIPGTVTTIEHNAFSCLDIKTVTIPDSVQQINSWAFRTFGQGSPAIQLPGGIALFF